MAAVVRRQASGFEVLRDSVKEAIIWGFVAHLVFNTWHLIFPMSGWDYGYSLIGVVQFLMSTIIPENWVPLLLLLLILPAVIALGWKFMPLIKSCIRTPWFTALSAVLVFGVTIGLFEVIYYGLSNGSFFFTPNLIYNTFPPLIIATIIIGGRSGKVELTTTGSRETIQVADLDEHDNV